MQESQTRASPSMMRPISRRSLAHIQAALKYAPFSHAMEDVPRIRPWRSCGPPRTWPPVLAAPHASLLWAPRTRGSPARTTNPRERSAAGCPGDCSSCRALYSFRKHALHKEVQQVILQRICRSQGWYQDRPCSTWTPCFNQECVSQHVLCVLYWGMFLSS